MEISDRSTAAGVRPNVPAGLDGRNMLPTITGGDVPDLPPPQRVELFDIENDPEERVNRASQHPEIVDKLSEKLDSWFRSVERDRLRTHR